MKELHLQEQGQGQEQEQKQGHEHEHEHDLSKAEGQPAVAEDRQEESDIVPLHITLKQFKILQKRTCTYGGNRSRSRNVNRNMTLETWMGLWIIITLINKERKNWWK